IGIVMFLYLGANLAYYLIIPQPEMAKMKAAETSATEDYGAGERGVDTSRSPDSEVRDKTVAIGFCRRLLGSVGVAVAAAGAAVSGFGRLDGQFMAGAPVRYYM